jgi:uncharacterized protein DUF3800
MPTLHLHFDESGDWTFGPKGSTYFVLAVAWTYDPQPLATALTSLRFSLIAQGTNLESFHAAEDKQAVRNAVVATLVANAGWEFAAVVLEKRKVNPVLRAPERFYPQFAGTLLKFVLRGTAFRRGTGRVLVYADTIPMNTNRKRDGVLKAIKTTCASELPAGTTHYVYSHCRESNKWLQVVDYACWSVARKWERGNLLTYNQLTPRLARTELNITARGDQTDYY